MSTLGQRLKQLRKQNDLSQKDVARHLGITVSALSQYETDKRTPKNEALLILAQLYHTSTDYLLGFSLTTQYPYSMSPTYAVKASSPGYHDDKGSASLEQEKQLLLASLNVLPASRQAQILSALNVLLQDLS